MKSIVMMIFIVAAGYIGSVNAAEIKTIKYFTSHIEEARAIAKNCDVKEVECKNAKYIAWETRGKFKKDTVQEDKSEPVKK